MPASSTELTSIPRCRNNSVALEKKLLGEKICYELNILERLADWTLKSREVAFATAPWSSKYEPISAPPFQLAHSNGVIP
jgi:hypothetical protein